MTLLEDTNHTPNYSAGNARTLLPTFGVACLLVFCFVMMSHKVPIGTAGALLAFGTAILRQTPFVIPKFFRFYILYFVMGILGWGFSDYPSIVQDQLVSILSIIVAGLAAANLLTTERDQRTFIIGYVTLFSLYPVRGALYNFAYGITDNGRIAWNFFFQNPNDLAMTCFLPMGLFAYLVLTERGLIRLCAGLGMPVIFGVLVLTQSRGAMLGLGLGIAYFVLVTPRRIRSLLTIFVVTSLCVSVLPSGAWERLAGLSKASIKDMSQVDPEGSASGRWDLMGVALGIAGANPFVGIGVGTYRYAHDRATSSRDDLRSDERGNRDAHSMYIRAAAETGFLGAIFILTYVVSAILHCRRMRARLQRSLQDTKRRMALSALEASMIAYSFAAIYNSAEQSTYTMWQFVVPCAIATLAGLKESGSTNHEPMAESM